MTVTRAGDDPDKSFNYLLLYAVNVAGNGGILDDLSRVCFFLLLCLSFCTTLTDFLC